LQWNLAGDHAQQGGLAHTITTNEARPNWAERSVDIGEKRLAVRSRECG
jgi:hypothetical protein